MDYEIVSGGGGGGVYVGGVPKDNARLSWWKVSFQILSGDGHTVETAICTQAANSRDAVLSASARLLLHEGERLHAIQLSPPLALKPEQN